MSTGPDFRSIEPGFGSFELAKPNFRRWGFFAVWRGEEALERFLGGPSEPRAWRAGTEEEWHVSLKPIRASGTWRGENPLGAFDATGLSHSPIVALTRADIRPSRLPAFWLGATKVAVTDVREAPGFLAGLAMTERPFVEVSTLTVWRSLEDVVRFTHERPAHSGLVIRNRKEAIFSAFFSAYFSPEWSRGTWNGCDPFADSALFAGHDRAGGASPSPTTPGRA